MLSLVDLYIIKESLDGHDILYVNICGQEFVFKTLGIKEYVDIKTCVNIDKDIEDAICQVTLVYPEHYRFSDSPYAGISGVISEHIKDMSGFKNQDIIMDRMVQGKEEMQMFEMQCINIVKAAMPEFAYEEIIEWSWPKLIDYAVRSEAILNIRGINVELVDNRSNLNTEENENNSNEDELVKQLRISGVDPMKYFAERFINQEKEIVDYPLIGGIHWQREDVLNAIRGQMVN